MKDNLDKFYEGVLLLLATDFCLILACGRFPVEAFGEQNKLCSSDSSHLQIAVLYDDSAVIQASAM